MRTIIISFATLLSIGALAQTTWTVDNNNNSGSNFTNLQTAIDGATAGDTIYIQPSAVSYGNITINKTIHLRGLGHYPEISGNVGSKIGNIAIGSTQNAQGISLSGIEFDVLSAAATPTSNFSNLSIVNCRGKSVTTSGTADHCSNWIVAGCVISNDGFGFFSKPNNNNWMIVNNIFQQPTTNLSWYIFNALNSSDTFRNNIIIGNYGAGSPTVFNNCMNLNIENSMILFSGAASGFNNLASIITYTNCLSYSYTGQTIPALSGVNNIDNTDPELQSIATNVLFSYNNNYSLQPQSPAAGAGNDGQDLGVFGNLYNFEMRGYPPDLPYPAQMNLQSTLVNLGGNISIQFQAEGN